MPHTYPQQPRFEISNLQKPPPASPRGLRIRIRLDPEILVSDIFFSPDPGIRKLITYSNITRNIGLNKLLKFMKV